MNTLSVVWWKPGATLYRGLAAFAAALGAIAAFAVLLPGSAAGNAVTNLLLGPAPHGLLARLLIVALGATLLALAWGLWRAKRRAVTVVAALLFAAGTARALQGAPLALSAAEGGIAVLLLAGRRAFTRGGDPRRGRIAGKLAVGAASCAYVLAVAIALVTDRAAGLGQALGSGATWLAEGGWWLHSGSPLVIALDAALAVCTAATAACVRGLLRPAIASSGHSPSEHSRAAALVAEYGSDSLDPFALREDKSFHFASGGVLGYRTIRETAVVAGDPVGPPGSAPAVLASFEALAAERGWDVVVTGASARYLDGYRALGFRALRIGQEAIVAPGDFSLEGRAVRKVRQSVTRVQRHGWQIELVHPAELTPSTTEELRTLESRWRDAQPRLQGFAMTLGRLWGAEEDASGLYVIARDPEGGIRSFLRFTAYRSGLSLDVTRRMGDEPNGLSEAMIVAALQWAREQGIEEVSLNFAGFAHVMTADAVLTRAQRLLRWTLRRLHGRFQLERLMHFNEKFFPTWRPRYLIYRGRSQLPLAALRVLQAEAYVRAPRQHMRPVRWRPSPNPVAVSGGRGGTPSLLQPRLR